MKPLGRFRNVGGLRVRIKSTSVLKQIGQWGILGPFPNVTPRLLRHKLWNPVKSILWQVPNLGNASLAKVVCSDRQRRFVVAFGLHGVTLYMPCQCPCWQVHILITSIGAGISRWEPGAVEAFAQQRASAGGCWGGGQGGEVLVFCILSSAFQERSQLTSIGAKSLEMLHKKTMHELPI